ncbi:DUF6452 family protein [Pseudozobellia thermophila]|uniref:DUF1735 domain-containing protein n=1 Tax=Pseudozobellia thermophila TaxID=192903 RepID=A0A1M6J5B8_9FLAO|nr:DUF6452 family protein [Pseudozobellia thermophila]SHJ41925.1 hypothetical protein SAMN04488513_104254 [Pseudozobellia thermophila]
MNKIRIAVIILLGILSFSACEKDDICIDADTPSLVIRFYDVSDPTEFKDVQNLIVRGLLPSGAQDTIDNVALDSIVLPLRVDSNTTSFTLSRQVSIDDINIDTLTFNYETKEIFKSRACGYIVNYEQLEASVVPSDSLWIQDVIVVDSTVENTASAHVKIFH